VQDERHTQTLARRAQGRLSPASEFSMALNFRAGYVLTDHAALVEL
jgi:hypothetical protein